MRDRARERRRERRPQSKRVRGDAANPLGVPAGPIAAKSFWRRMAVRSETFIDDVYEAARLVKGIDEAQRVALNILKLVYMLLLTGDA